MSPSFKLTRTPTLAVLACLALTALVVAEGAATASAAPSATRSCSPPKYPGAGYFTGKINVSRISCAYGKSFVRSFYKCRTKSGRRPTGRCTRVRGFRCSEKRNSIPTEINARATCKRGTQRIVHTYQQNLE
ncbi:MAG: hypothetical protein WKF42_01385 [Solirubrobacteraceae bacterium]